MFCHTLANNKRCDDEDVVKLIMDCSKINQKVSPVTHLFNSDLVDYARRSLDKDDMAFVIQNINECPTPKHALKTFWYNLYYEKFNEDIRPNKNRVGGFLYALENRNLVNKTVYDYLSEEMRTFPEWFLITVVDSLLETSQLNFIPTENNDSIAKYASILENSIDSMPSVYIDFFSYLQNSKDSISLDSIYDYSMKVIDHKNDHVKKRKSKGPFRSINEFDSLYRMLDINNEITYKKLFSCLLHLDLESEFKKERKLVRNLIRGPEFNDYIHCMNPSDIRWIGSFLENTGNTGYLSWYREYDKRTGENLHLKSLARRAFYLKRTAYGFLTYLQNGIEEIRPRQSDDPIFYSIFQLAYYTIMGKKLNNSLLFLRPTVKLFKIIENEGIRKKELYVYKELGLFKLADSLENVLDVNEKIHSFPK